MERNENGYSSYNFSRTAPGCEGGCAQGAPRENSGNGARYMQSENTSNERLAMAYVPMQRWRMLYAPDAALMRGTMFEELDLPLEECQ